jgi:membrane protease YdiL (CAAX protease family)
MIGQNKAINLMSLAISISNNLALGQENSPPFADKGSCWNAVEKIKNIAFSPVGQVMIGLGIGLHLDKIYMPLTEKIFQLLGGNPNAAIPDPFADIGYREMLLLSPVICVLGPLLEEGFFRGSLQDAIKNKSVTFFESLGTSKSVAETLARVTSIFFASILFGLVHFTNAIAFGCSPFLFLPQVIGATIMGFLFGLAKEYTGQLHMPIGMHMGNNLLGTLGYLSMKA